MTVARVERHAADIAAVIEKLGLGPADVMGHSYGGVVAVSLAKSRPELVRRLILAEPSLFGVIRDKNTLAEIASLADTGKFIADAPLCFAIFGEKKQRYYLEDCCAATENLILALQAYGVSSCWVAGDKKPCGEPIRNLLGVPEGYTLVSLVAAGCPADITITPKKEMKHIAFFETFKAE